MSFVTFTPEQVARIACEAVRQHADTIEVEHLHYGEEAHVLYKSDDGARAQFFILADGEVA